MTEIKNLAPGISGLTHRALNLITAHPSMPLAQLYNMNRLADLVAAHRDEITVFCSHDTSTYRELARGAEEDRTADD